MTQKLQTIKKHPSFGTATRPRVCVSRSNQGIVAQVIDDEKGTTLFSGSTLTISDKKTPVEKAKMLGLTLANTAKDKKITSMVYDRNGIRYHGRVKAVAEGIREGGIKL